MEEEAVMVKMGTVWDRTAEFLTDNLPSIVPIALIAFFVPFSVMGSFQPLVTETTPGLRLVLELIILAAIVVITWGMLMLTAMVLDGGGGAGRIALRRLGPALAVAVAIFLAMMLIFAPIVLTLMVSGVDLAAIARGTPVDVSMPSSVAWSIGIYGILAALVCIWLGARLAVVNAVIVREKAMFGALLRSWALTRGVAWRIVGVMFLYAVVSNVAALAAQLVFGTVFSLIAGGGGGTLSLASVLTSVIVAAVQTGFTVLAPVFAAKLYVALAAERERAVRS
ncbi:hypothetical protein [Sphingomonas sp. G-3-2-10]|uniref:hypothetical protein n=1 Tax=Sphingomonas sp. G-3-2-10 TaxID=2728838 RepID=UPI00146E37A1|nr:hypothetical protein [Sphingomonas sp. G-3-2-10]NML06099.1 hypothetical protein [Sphingomonas sp. G-3-2-10]